MGSKIDRTGEVGHNTFGSEMIIVGYRMNRDMDVYFPEYNWITENVQYNNFKRGTIKCPYEPSVFGVGYVGEGEYKSKINGKLTRVYSTWYQMLERCYDEKCQEKNPTYINCEVCNEWYSFQNFAEWCYKNYYTIKGEQMCLDKDILLKGNKIYSPETCIFVPKRINSLFTKSDKSRGNSVIGTSPKNGKYVVHCNLINPKTGKSKQKNLGHYDTELEAFEVYKYYKERNIKMVADYYEEQIPINLYNALYEYEVEITD